jgi:hypothetical protein
MTVKSDDWFEPTTLSHEYGHAVMQSLFPWYADLISSLAGAMHALEDGRLPAYHHTYEMITDEHKALVEGWAEIVSCFFLNNFYLFDTNGDGSYEVYTDLASTASVELSSTPQLGCQVEGAFAIAFVEYLKTFGVSTFNLSDEADLRISNPWVVSSAFMAAFQAALWTPLKNLAAAVPDDWDGMTVSAFVAQVASSMNATDYTTFRAGYLTKYNLV